MPCLDNENFIMTVFLGPEWIAQELRNDIEMLVLDVRSHSDFQASHIRGAINVSIPTLMLRRLKKGNLTVSSVIQSNEGKEKFNQMSKTHTIVVYDDCTTDTNTNPTSVLNLLSRKLREDGCRVCCLQGGFSAIKELFPEYCDGEKDGEEGSIMGLCNLRISDRETTSSGEESEDPTTPFHMSPFPVEVLPYLFLGNSKNSADMDALEKHNIKYILNVTPNLPNVFENNDKFKYMQIPISDHWSQNLSIFFPEAIKFIDEARLKKQGVLVHCLAGISRSVTVTVAYLMSKLEMSLNDAYDYVKKCKPNISPNFNFMGQLLDFEQTLNLSPKECLGKGCCGGCQSSGAPCPCKGEPKTFFMTPTKTSPNFELEVAPS